MTMSPARHLLAAVVLSLPLPAALAQSYSGPESVEYHARLDRHLISNTASGQILARDADGELSLFTDESTSPYGLELMAGILYAADSGRVDGYDIDSGERIVEIAIPGASFLNGLTSNGTDTVYVSDFSGRSITRIDLSDIENPIVEPPISTGARTPNGLAFDRAGNRLLVATWGSNAAILSLDLGDPDALPTVLIETTLGNLDGITLACDGGLVVSAWSGCGASGGCLRGFEPPLALDSPPIVITDGLASPADIDFARPRGEVGVPESSANRIALVPIPGCTESAFFSDFER